MMVFEEDKLNSYNEKQLNEAENDIENIIETNRIESEKAIESKKNVSKAADSKILSVDQEREKLKQLVEAMGIKQLSEEVDILKESVKAIAVKTSETIDAVNQLTSVIQNGAAAAPTDKQSSSNLDPAKLEQMGNFFEQLSHVWSNFKGNNQPAAAPLIDQDFINQKMKSAVLEDLETGENIRRFISTALKQKATKSVVNTALGDLGATNTNVNPTAPGNTHQYGPR